MNSFISTAYASSHVSTAQGFVTAINNAILFPIIALLMAVAFIVFLYGAFVFVKNANNDAARETGRNHLIYGVIGMLVMLSAFAILNVAANTFGLSDELNNASNPPSSLAPGSSFRPPAGRSPSGATPSIADRYTATLAGDGYDVNDPRSGVYSPTPPPGPEGDFGGPTGFGSSDLSIDGSAGVSITTGTNNYVPRSVPAQPLSPEQETVYERYVEKYEVTASTDETAVLQAYQQYGVSEVVFMVPLPGIYTQTGGNGTQEVGSYDQQVAMCGRKGGSIANESGANRVTSIDMYICLK